MPPHVPVVWFGWFWWLGLRKIVSKNNVKSSVFIFSRDLSLLPPRVLAILHHLIANSGVKRMWPVPFEGLYLEFIFTPRVQLFRVERVIKASLLWRDFNSSYSMRLSQIPSQHSHCPGKKQSQMLGSESWISNPLSSWPSNSLSL